MMGGCQKCRKITAILFLLLGLALLLVDLGVWTFFNIQWWSGLFVLVGVVGIAKSTCKNCQEAIGAAKK